MEGLYFTDIKSLNFRYLLTMRGLEQKYKPDRIFNDRDKILKEKIIAKIIWSHCLIGKTDQESKLNNFSPTPSPPTFVLEIHNLSYRFIKNIW